MDMLTKEVQVLTVQDLVAFCEANSIPLDTEFTAACGENGEYGRLFTSIRKNACSNGGKVIIEIA